MPVVVHIRKVHVEGMYTLKIEHPIRDFDTWKAAFGRDPVGRQRSGVRRYRVCRPIDDPHYVYIDLDFEEEPQARAFLRELQEKVWRRAELSPALPRENDAPAVQPRTRIVQVVDSTQY
jgi:hypothetical protein